MADYIRAQSEYYYVDKTLMMKQLLDQKALVSLFTRPRRFGKTLNMDMLRVFFEISSEDTSVYFRDKAIWKCGDAYRKHQGKYPVIFLTLKDVKFDSWSMTLDKIRALLQVEYGRHMELQESQCLADFEKEYFSKILNGTAGIVELSSVLENLSRMLHEHYHIAPVINYISRDCLPQAYWVNTGKNEILEDVLRSATDDITERLYALVQGERVIARIDQNVIYRALGDNPANIYSLPLVAGYLKTAKKELQPDGSYLCEVSIPNKEIAAVYKSKILA